MAHDIINHPNHYTFSRIEVLDAIEAWKLDYHLACVVKYLARAPHKGNELQDLKKAQFYLNRYIDLKEQRPRNKRKFIKGRKRR
jgi:hypothetical protein